MKSRFCFIFLILIHVCACRSQQIYERAGAIESKINELNNSRTYFGKSTVDEIVSLRLKMVEELLMEGDEQRKIVIESNSGEAKYAAGFCYLSILRLSGKKYSITDLELTQTWNSFKKLYGHGNNEGDFLCFLGLHTIIPVGYLGDIGAFIVDMLSGWRDIENKIDIPPLVDVYILRAEMGLADLEKHGFSIPND